MNGRGVIAACVLAAWGAGVAVFAQREISRSPRARLAEAAMRVAPGATFFAVEREGRQVGFASVTVDTVPGGLQVTDYAVVDRDDGGTVSRWTAKSVVRLSRALALREFRVSYGDDRSTRVATGRTSGDTLLEYVVREAGAVADTFRVPLSGPLLTPSLVPLAVALGRDPAVGTRYVVDTFDPVTMRKRPMSVTLAAESVFVVVDSAAFDTKTRRWTSAHADTVRAWRMKEDGRGLDTWVDESGRLISIHAPADFTLQRTAYELAFENWRKGRSPM